MTLNVVDLESHRPPPAAPGVALALASRAHGLRDEDLRQLERYLPAPLLVGVVEALTAYGRVLAIRRDTRRPAPRFQSKGGFPHDAA